MSATLFKLSILFLFLSNPLLAGGKSVCGAVLDKAVLDNETFGGEWTYTNKQLIEAGFLDVDAYANEANRQAQKKWIESLKGRQDLSIEKIFVRKIKGEPDTFDYRVINNATGWWYTVSLDPGVIEIKTKPSSIEAYEKLKSYIRDEVFKRAKNLGLKPHADYGGGHIHIGILRFKTYLHFRNFLADLYNNELIFPYIFDEGAASTATPVFLMPKGFQQRLSKIFEEVDKLKLKDMDKIILLCKRIKKEVYTENLGFGGGSFEEIPKYFAINVNHVADDIYPMKQKTIELRPFRAQRNIEEYLMQIKLLNSRIEYLASFDKPIEYDMASGKPWDFQVVAAYKKYVEESKLSWEAYKKLMPEKYQGVK